MKQIFGIPLYQTSIDSSSYNKTDLIEAIEKNYFINPQRNNWDNEDKYSSKLHHALDDFDNNNFIKPDFSQLSKIYEKEIYNFFNNMNFSKEFCFNYKIVSYTCMLNSQFIKDHVHDSDFTAVHYIKFNPSKHFPTYFLNTAGFGPYIGHSMHLNLRNILDISDIQNSWATQYFTVKTKEDDFIITPGILNHFVPASEESDETRITVVVNINLELNE